MHATQRTTAIVGVLLGISAGVSVAAELAPPVEISYSDSFEPGSTPGFTTVFGSPAVAAAPAPMGGSALVFNTAGNEQLIYDQVRYATTENGYAARRVTLGFDLLTVDLLGSNNAFTVVFDTPEIRNLVFSANGTIEVVTFGAGATGGPIGSFADGELLSVLTALDLGTNRWEVQVNGTTLYSDVVVSAAALGVTSVRFNHGSSSVTDGDPVSFSYLDEVQLSATDFVALPQPPAPIPLPAALWGLLAGLGALATRARR